MKDNIIKYKYNIMFVICSILFALPSVIYVMKNKTIYRFIWMRTYFFRLPLSINEKLLNGLIFFLLFSAMFLLYYFILKFSIKIFKNNKQIFILIILVAILFLLIIPYTSSDVYSYIANGWAASNYGENPYYVSIGEIADKTGINDTMFNKVARCWRYEPVVYGPLFTLICTVLTKFSLGNIDIALLLFKLANLIIHILNCILINKITKKKLFVLIYGLNPAILFEALSNAHNDIYVVLFILLSIYFVLKRKNLFLGVACIAMATAIKYFAILLLPFIIIYHVRDKKIGDRIKSCILYGLEYIVIIALIYCIYLRDLQVLTGLFVQQEKYNRSIFFILYWFFKDKYMNYLVIMRNVVFVLFVILYIYTIIKLLIQKELNFYRVIRKYNIIIMIFTFIIITNFNPWYIMWIFPTMFWLKGKSIMNILYLSYAGQIGNILGFALYSEEEWLGLPYFAIMLVLTLMLNKTSNKKILKKGV